MAAISFLKNKLFTYSAAAFITIIGILSLNSGLILRGSVHTLQNYWLVLTGSEAEETLAKSKSGVQEVNITVLNNGYKADVNTLKVGVPVKLTLTTKGIKSCSRAFAIPEFNLSEILPETGTKVIEFTPEKTGTLSYTCTMGMYTGSFNVVN